MKAVTAPIAADVGAILYDTVWQGAISWSVMSSQPSDFRLNERVVFPTPALAPAVRDAFAHLSEFTNLHVAEGGGQTATLRFAQIANTGNLAGFAYFPAPYPEAGDVFLTTGTVRDLGPGSFGWLVLLHEIGHALGLVHPHETDGFTTLPASEDSVELTLMSYRSYPGASVRAGLDYEPGGYTSTYMAVDMAALQHLYGANYAHAAGNTRYVFDAFEPTMLKAIWDGGGIDTYDFSNYRNGLSIDLMPGAGSVTGQEPLANYNATVYDRAAPIHVSASVQNARLYDGNWASAIENAVGGHGHDTIHGNPLANRLEGRGGNDEIRGAAGDDVLFGGAGNDRLFAGNGADRLFGESGADRLVAGHGADRIDGGNQNDRLYGDAGDDLLLGGQGADVLLGGLHRDYLSGGNGDDHLKGEHAADTLRGDDGNDKLFGGGGSDVLRGDAHADLILGGSGHDRIFGGEGNDTAFGEIGRDTVMGEGGNDALRGGDHADLLSGGAGFDTLRGDDGHDRLDGGANNDTLTGGAGRDRFVVLTEGGGFDAITDFTIGADKIDVPNPTYALANLQTRGSSTLIQDGADAVLIINVSMETLSASDFI